MKEDNNNLEKLKEYVLKEIKEYQKSYNEADARLNKKLCSPYEVGLLTEVKDSSLGAIVALSKVHRQIIEIEAEK